MEGAAEVEILARELAQAVELTMNPAVIHEDRLEAYTACERFKESSPLCAQAGLFLASGQNSDVVRHFGLQLMEHMVKYRWINISQQEKIFIKENAMKLLCSGIGALPEQSHMKDALSRVIVEMIKREWPQQWPTLLAELSDACTRGEAQTELVLMVFLRLVEDVALLQTLESNNRRKDIYQALTSHMSQIFEFFLRLIDLHVGQFRGFQNVGNMQQAASHSRVVQVVLLTLTGFVEWVSIVHIMATDGRLLQILCILLTDPSFQLAAAECLLHIVSRKGQIKERKPLLILFSEDAMNCIFRATGTANAIPVEEQHYLFLKKLTQVLAGLGTQICALWGREDGINARPAHFCTYLDAVLTFTCHPSLTLSHLANSIWMSLFKHDQISKDQVFLTYVPKWVECTGPKIIKVNYPIARPIGAANDTSAYISMDYDSEEEFAMFFHRCRSDFLDNFRQSTLIAPLVTFSYVEQWLTVRIRKSAQENHNTNGNIHDPVYLEWEALSQILESILSRILLVAERPSVNNGLGLLEMCLNYEPRDPLLLSTLLSCISALFVFLSMSSCQITAGNCVAMSGVSLLPRVLDKIFAALVFSEPGQTKDTRSRAVKNVRRHAASLMVKIGHKYPLLLLPVFDQINSTVQRLNKDPGQLSKMEQITLQEALLLISNHFCDYDRQTNFIREAMGDGLRQWSVIAPAFKSPADFMRFVGLDSPPVEPSTKDINGQNRGHIMYCCNTILGIVKRCSWPDDPDRASRGQFVVGLTESGNPICRNPATVHVVPILTHILALVRVLNELWTPQALALLSEGYRSAHAMLEVDRTNLLGSTCAALQDPMDPNARKSQSPLDRMQHFLSIVHDSCYHLLGSMGPSLGRHLYELPGIAQALVDTVFHGIEHIPDYRLRPIIRVFLRPFIYSCPAVFYDAVLLPIIAHVAPYMLNRLSTRWQYITTLYESGKLDDDSNDTQEVLEDMLNRNLTREYLDVLKVALVGGTIIGSDPNNFSSMEHDDLSMDGPPPTLTRAAQSAIASDVISDLGNKLLRCEQTRTPLILTVLNAIAWNDSNSSLKATFLTGPVIRFLASEHALNSQIAVHVMVVILQGLQLHGQHDANQGSLLTLGVQMYEILRPKFPCVFEVMKQIPNVNLADLQKLDEKIATGSGTKGNKIDKARKDLFKKITSQLIGRSMAELFRKEVKIANLPSIVKQDRPSINLVDQSNDTGIVKLFADSS